LPIKPTATRGPVPCARSRLPVHATSYSVRIRRSYLFRSSATGRPHPRRSTVTSPLRAASRRWGARAHCSRVICSPLPHHLCSPTASTHCRALGPSCYYCILCVCGRFLLSSQNDVRARRTWCPVDRHERLIAGAVVECVHNARVKVCTPQY
jgi:hypothetical protein